MLKTRATVNEGPFPERRLGTGLARLDDLLDGGLPKGSTALVLGPPFVGKEVLPRRFLLEGLRLGTPAVLVSTTSPLRVVQRRLTAIEPGFAGHDETGLVHVVDAYSRTAGLEDGVQGVAYVEGPDDLEGIARAVQEATAEHEAQHRPYRLAIDSLSTIAAYAGQPATFRFLRTLLARARRGPATTMMLLDRGMHAESEVLAYQHLADGLLELKRENAKLLLHAEGLGLTEDRGWVEYLYSEKELSITGSFSVGRIR